MPYGITRHSAEVTFPHFTPAKVGRSIRFSDDCVSLWGFLRSHWCLDVGGSRQVGRDMRQGRSLFYGTQSRAYAMYFYRAMLSIRGTSHGPVSVCPSQVGVLSKRLNESSCFLHVSFLPPILHCIKRKFGYLQNEGTSLWNFVLNSGLKKFRHGISIVQTCYQLSSRKVDAHSVINWAVVGQLSR